MRSVIAGELLAFFLRMPEDSVLDRGDPQVADALRIQPILPGGLLASQDFFDLGYIAQRGNDAVGITRLPEVDERRPANPP